MELLSHIGFGLSVAAQPENLAFALLGCLIGTLIGVLPGLGPLATLSMLLPITFHLEPVTALIMLAGIYYGAQYGGSTTAILVNLPGESSAVVTCLDGHQMARQGRAGAALAIAGLGSFFAGTVATLVIAAMILPLTRLALTFGAAEYFSLMVLGLIAAVVMARGAIFKALAMTIIGLLLGLVGTDVPTGIQRFTFGSPELYEGLDFVTIAVGVFGLGSIIASLEAGEDAQTVSVLNQKITRLWPSRDDFRRAWPAVLRGTGLGCVLGVLPGGGAILSSFTAYAIERKLARDPSRFGKGAVEGVAAPESANNAGAQTSFIPMLTLGIPPNPVMAVMVGALMIHGVRPGPQVLEQRPDLFWGMIASMWIGNLMLIVINLPLIGIWVKLLKVPYRLLFPAILLFSSIGVYSVNNSTFDVVLAAGFGVLGYVFAKIGCEPAPLALGFVLGPMLEETLRRAMLLSRGDPLVFFERPLSCAMLITAAVILAVVLSPQIKRGRNEAFQEQP
ncbi:tripartite tricarboxylate transporter permease [Bosea sp. 117]|uniref:tripartite tricarboxylate transporter permease n=1 Tax=Bosea sp. 117 TaxID=1125973 RepID=UPI000494570E|nr:tripartite tricarboxylate transporter permease [Bosea sp. 117]